MNTTPLTNTLSLLLLIYYVLFAIALYIERMPNRRQRARRRVTSRIPEKHLLDDYRDTKYIEDARKGIDRAIAQLTLEGQVKK